MSQDSHEWLGPLPERAILPRVRGCPFAVFDEFGRGADDRVQDYAAALVAAERERIADACRERRGHFASDLAARSFAKLVRDGLA